MFIQYTEEIRTEKETDCVFLCLCKQCGSVLCTNTCLIHKTLLGIFSPHKLKKEKEASLEPSN